MSGEDKGQHFRHDAQRNIGILISNLGTPDAPTTSALRRYLREFLWDPRIVDMPRLLWWCILQVILLIRPSRSAKSYRSVWTERGSPLLAISQQQTEALRAAIATRLKQPVAIALAMRYGNPSIRHALQELRQANVDRVLVLPLYPQYSSCTTASTFDAIATVIKDWRWIPEFRFINQYHDHDLYIQALANSIEESWAKQGQAAMLLFSFHGIPKRFLMTGDPYHCMCQATARLIAERLGLVEGRWQITFQSRFGREEWLQPYTMKTLQTLANSGIKSVDVVCPGFSADCLETLEEIAVENRHAFLGAGGERYNYIPALNDRPDHIAVLEALIENNTQGWLAFDLEWDSGQQQRMADQRALRAKALGAAS